MAPRTSLPIQKLLICFYLREETQRAVADMMDTNKCSVNRVILHYEKTGSVKAKQPVLNLPGELWRVGATSCPCPRLTAPRLNLNWSMGDIYTVSGVKYVMRSHETFGRIVECEEQLIPIH